MSEPIDISPSQRKELLTLIQRHLPTIEVWAFGSRVKWMARSNSDLDLVAFAKPEDEGRVSRLKEALEESSLPFRVDVLVWDNIPENFQKNISERYVVLVEAEKSGQGRVMSADWPEISLGSVTTWLSGGTPNKGTRSFWNGDIPWISANSMYGTRFFDSDLKITESGLSAGSRLAPTNSILLLVRGGALHNRLPVGMACRDLAFNQDVKALIADSNRLDPWFLLYWLIGNERLLLDEVVEETGIGAGKLDTKRMQALQMKLPPITLQKRIAKVARSIDDKIGLNHRINQTLEAMAQAIFKSWFVDFDPVKAKIAAIAEGRDPLRAAMIAISGKPDVELDALPPEQYAQLAATAALFPDGMEESELGEIPRGWAPGVLSAVCDLNANSWSAKTLPASVKYVDLANSKNGEVIEVQTIEGVNIPSRARRILEDGDTIVGTVRPGNRSFALVGESGLTGSTGFAVLRPRKSYLREYVYLAATADANIERLAHLADGGAYPAVCPELVVSDALPIPSEDLLREFHRISSPMFDQTLEMRRANRSLADLRDTLLPKLLSGELSVAPIDTEPCS